MGTSVKHTAIKKFERGQILPAIDLLATEEPLEIRITSGPKNLREEKKIAVTMRTPGNDLELVLGFLFTEDIIQSYNDVISIRHCESVEKVEERNNVVKVELRESVVLNPMTVDRNFYTSSSCGVCGKSSIESVAVNCSFDLKSDPSKVNMATLHALPETIRKVQNVFEHTGGIHASALFDLNGELLFVREDVGRHNALDKIIGAALFKNEVPLSNRILLVSGRASFELAQKAIRAGIPILSAIGAPSSLAVDVAIKNNMTLIGFLSENRFNIYCGEERVV